MITADIYNRLKNRSSLSSGLLCNWGLLGVIFCSFCASSRLLEFLLLLKIRLKSNWSTSYCDENWEILKFKQRPGFVLYESNYSSDSSTSADYQAVNFSFHFFCLTVFLFVLFFLTVMFSDWWRFFSWMIMSRAQRQLKKTTRFDWSGSFSIIPPVSFSSRLVSW